MNVIVSIQNYKYTSLELHTGYISLPLDNHVADISKKVQRIEDGYIRKTATALADGDGKQILTNKQDSITTPALLQDLDEVAGHKWVNTIVGDVILYLLASIALATNEEYSGNIMRCSREEADTKLFVTIVTD